MVADRSHAEPRPVYGSLRSARAAADAFERDEHHLKLQGRKLRDALSKRVGAASSLFRLMDVDGNGVVSREEFHEAVAALGVRGIDPTVVDELFQEFDADGSGEISYAEYLQYALRDQLRRSCTRVMDCFRSFDIDGNGVVDRYEFRRAINGLGWEVFDPFLLDEVPMKLGFSWQRLTWLGLA